MLSRNIALSRAEKQSLKGKMAIFLYFSNISNQEILHTIQEQNLSYIALSRAGMQSFKLFSILLQNMQLRNNTKYSGTKFMLYNFMNRTFDSCKENLKYCLLHMILWNYHPCNLIFFQSFKIDRDYFFHINLWKKKCFWAHFVLFFSKGKFDMKNQ